MWPYWQPPYHIWSDMEAAEPSANIERHNVSWDPFVSGIPFFFQSPVHIYSIKPEHSGEVLDDQ